MPLSLCRWNGALPFLRIQVRPLAQTTHQSNGFCLVTNEPMHIPLRHIALTVLLAFPLAPTGAENSPSSVKPLRAYFIGNSVTDTLNYRAFAKSVQGAGHELVWGRQMIPGSPLFLLWRHAEEKPNDCGFTEKPFGGSVQALREFPWDVVTLQPFDRLLANPDAQNADEQGDVLYSQKYLDLLWQRSPEAQVYIYARWPRMQIKGKGVQYDKDAYDKPAAGKTADWAQVDPYEQRWLAKYTGGWDGGNETADYFETLTRILRRVNPQARRPVLMIPVGHVMLELDRQMRAGELPGYKGIYDVYKDAIHLTGTGGYIVGCTFYATLYRKNPAQFPAEPYGVTDARVVTAIKETVWKVVSNHPLAGIAPQEPASR